jgi:hypothetical protein
LMDTTTYVYCVVHRDRVPALRSMPPGIPDASPPVLLPFAARLWLVVSEVPREAYAPATIERRLHDLDWVSVVALAHEAVVERMARVSGATVIPMKLFTMFSGPDPAVADMRSRRPVLEKIVKHIAKCHEWGVRVTRGAPAPARPARAGSAPSGTAFLAARKQVRDGARERSGRMVAAAEDVLAALGRIARETKRRPAPEAAASPPLLDAAFLVPEARRARFTAAVKSAAARCTAAGAELTLTGPWPAYNFIDAGDSRS